MIFVRVSPVERTLHYALVDVLVEDRGLYCRMSIHLVKGFSQWQTTTTTDCPKTYQKYPAPKTQASSAQREHVSAVFVKTPKTVRIGIGVIAKSARLHVGPRCSRSKVRYGPGSMKRCTDEAKTRLMTLVLLRYHDSTNRMATWLSPNDNMNRRLAVLPRDFQASFES